MTIQEIADETEAHGYTGEESRQSFAEACWLKELTHSTTFTEMDIDEANLPGLTAESVSRGTGRTRKRGRSKGSVTMVFPVSIKGKRVGTRLRARERKKSLKR